jgi:uncharacterized Tic20 family protein
MQAQIQAIRCPHCYEYIDARAATCRFCHGHIDPLSARTAAELQKQVNEAYNTASWLRNVAVVCVIIAVVQFFLPLLESAGKSVGLTIFFALPIMLIVWWVRYGRLQTDDPDYPRAKRNWQIALLLWSLVLVVEVGIVALLRAVL